VFPPVLFPPYHQDQTHKIQDARQCHEAKKRKRAASNQAGLNLSGTGGAQVLLEAKRESDAQHAGQDQTKNGCHILHFISSRRTSDSKVFRITPRVGKLTLPVSFPAIVESPAH